MSHSSLRGLGKMTAFAFSIVLIYLAFHKVQWSETLNVLRNANYDLVLLGAIVGLGGFVVRAFGWKFLLTPVASLKGWRLFSPVAIGYMANNLLPARLGEFARAYVVGKRERVSKTAALGTIFLERIYDGLTLLMIFAVVSLSFSYLPWVKKGGMIVAAVFICLSTVLAIFTIKLELGLRLVDRTVGRLWPKLADNIKSHLRNFVLGLDLRNHFGTALLAFLLTMLRWLFEACIYICPVYALGLQEQIPLHGVLFVMVTVNIACMIPQAPGYIGSVQLACIESLALFGVDREMAVAYSLLVHASFFFPITIAGIVCLLTSRLSFDEIRRSRETDISTSDKKSPTDDSEVIT